MIKMCKVLIVEDDEVTAMAMYEMISRRGDEVEVAKSFNEAISKLKNNKYNIIITDIGLKDREKNGHSVIAYARSTLNIRAPIILFSNYPKSMYEGKDTYIQKPNFGALMNQFKRLRENVQM